MKVQNASTHALRCRSREHAHTAVGQFKGQFNVAMEDMSGKVQNANTHRLGSQNHEHAHSSRSVQVPVQWGDGENVSEGSKGEHYGAGLVVVDLAAT